MFSSKRRVREWDRCPSHRDFRI